MEVDLLDLSDDEDLRLDDSAENLDPASPTPSPRAAIQGQDSFVGSANKPVTSSFSFLPNRKSSPSRTSRLYDDAANRAQKLEKKRLEYYRSESEGLFQPDLKSSAKKRAKSLAGMFNDMEKVGECCSCALLQLHFIWRGVYRPSRDLRWPQV